jgi:hypothetical protein
LIETEKSFGRCSLLAQKPRYAFIIVGRLPYQSQTNLYQSFNSIYHQITPAKSRDDLFFEKCNSSSFMDSTDRWFKIHGNDEELSWSDCCIVTAMESPPHLEKCGPFIKPSVFDQHGSGCHKNL